MSKALKFPKPPQQVASPADSAKITGRAKPLIDDPTSMMMENGQVYFTGRGLLDIDATTVSMPISALLAAAAHVLATLAVPMFAQAEHAMHAPAKPE